jgi:nucleotide-binding universal stress UspA family protein
MVKLILASMTGAQTDGLVLSATEVVARVFNAYVHAVHSRFDPTAIARAAGVAHPTGVIADLVERLEHAAAEREAAASAAVTEFCARKQLPLVTDAAVPPNVQWRVEPSERLAICGMTADLIVAARPAEDDPASAALLTTFLFQTGRPVLIPATTPFPDILRRVVVAWKPTPQAARAPVFAMPFLSRAQAVTVLTAAEDAPDRVDLAGVVAYLGAHGIQAEGRILTAGRRDAIATVLTEAEDASLLVMGAYGHTRLGEWLFGGFTRAMIGEAPLPVLMVH